MSDTSTDDTEPTEKTPRISVPQVTAGAMAAATAAILGSQLGVAGTVFGAAVGSVASAVAGTVYQAGIEKTHHHIKHLTVLGTRRIRGIEPTEEARAATAPLATDTTAAQAADPAEAGSIVLDATPHDAEALASTGDTDATVLLPTADPDATTVLPIPDPDATTVLPVDGTVTTAEKTRPAGTTPPRRRWPVLVGASLASAAAAFAISLGAITGFEALTGESLSGGQGTSLGQIAQGRRAVAAEPTATSSSGSSAEPTSTETGTSASSTEPASTSSVTPTPASATTTTSTEATPTASATPSATRTTPTSGTSPAGVSTQTSTPVATAAATVQESKNNS
ncbi:hypothetical protein [Propionicicella superfundia]|uniref:hypothetical protein n=1 Tax=Propionicicella superfundia TaxID=348582 RepID=UPI0012EB82C0|nr:hypothetical protein [Propionicicella superfundia]